MEDRIKDARELAYDNAVNAIMALTPNGEDTFYGAVRKAVEAIRDIQYGNRDGT